MWLGPIQNSEFAAKVLEGIEGQQAQYKTWARMHGMLTVAKEVSPLMPLDMYLIIRVGLTLAGIDRPFLLYHEQDLRHVQHLVSAVHPCRVR